jgi:hypothetical protein
MAAWDRAHNEGRIVGAWRPFKHPQLGEVEIGGYDPLIGIWNPPPERLGEVCDKLTRYFLRLASLAPRLAFARAETTEIAEGLHRITAVIENRGYLPTFVLGSSKSRPWNDPVRASVMLGEGLELVSGDATETVGHLAGWGGNDRNTTPMLARTMLEQPRKQVSWVVRGSGTMTLSAGCARVGHIESTLSIGP